MNINFRVFRRNQKNLILLWSFKHLTDDQRENLRAYAVEADKYRELSYRPFVPDNPDKFPPDVCGIVIGHSVNSLDPDASCTIRVMLGTDNVLEFEKEAKPATPAGAGDALAAAASRSISGRTSPEAEPTSDKTINVRMYAFDSQSKYWVPVPIEALPALKCETILLKESD